MSADPSAWTPASWQAKRAEQQPEYADAAALDRVLGQLARLPPLVTSWEIEALKTNLAAAAAGDQFLLQGGDCAETFDDCESGIIAGKLKILLQMSLILVHASRRRVIRVGRFAGQYAKPRSAGFETRAGVSLPVYRGDLINLPAFRAADRNPDPELLLRGYERSALTINFIRSLVAGGFADLHHPEYWDLDFVRHSPLAAEYRRVVGSIGEALRFMETLAGHRVAEMSRVDFYTSHEGLHLLYEQAQTRRVPHRPGWYNLATHFPWIGLRTSDPDGAHVEYFRGLSNPIAVKIGPETPPEMAVELAHRLDPQREPGRLTFIHRCGVDRIEGALPSLVEAMQRAEHPVLWICDPMHGNTVSTAEGTKTRHFDDIRRELELAFDVHERLRSRLGGMHIELTGEDVTECVGGARGITDADLGRAYRSQVDPRLNYEQSLELAILVAQKMGGAATSAVRRTSSQKGFAP